MKLSGILVLMLAFALSAFATQKKAIVKASVIKGESFVTANSLPAEIEQVLKEILVQKNYEIVDSIGDEEDLFYFDVFIFQYPADYPTVTLTVRTKNGIHHIDKESVSLFVNREAANIKITEKVAERLPDEIDTNKFYQVSISDVFSNERISLTGAVATSIMDGYRSNYFSSIKWPVDTSPVFIFPGDFDEYLSYCSNYQGIRSKIKDQQISVILSINEKGRFEILKIDPPIELNEKQKIRIHNMIDAFPMWIVDEKINPIELSLGLK